MSLKSIQAIRTWLTRTAFFLLSHSMHWCLSYCLVPHSLFKLYLASVAGPDTFCRGDQIEITGHAGVDQKRTFFSWQYSEDLFVFLGHSLINYTVSGYHVELHHENSLFHQCCWMEVSVYRNSSSKILLAKWPWPKWSWPKILVMATLWLCPCLAGPLG